MHEPSIEMDRRCNHRRASIDLGRDLLCRHAVTIHIFPKPQKGQIMSDLRAACDRLRRRDDNRESREQVYGPLTPPEIDNQMEQWEWQFEAELTDAYKIAEHYLATHPADGFQSRVRPWMQECFGDEISRDVTERCHRFLEESLELVQSLGMQASEAHQLVEYVFSRPVGQTQQEVGGTMVTLAALCLAASIDMHECGEVELRRIWGKVEQIRAKQAAKPKHSPLPMHPADGAEPITLKTWTDLFGDRKDIKGSVCGRLTFSGVNGVANTTCVWLNGEIIWLASHPDAHLTTMKQLRDLLAALGVVS